MLIKPELAAAFNQQIGHEFGASMQYLAISGYFQQHHLTLLAKLFTEQAEEEKEHAMKFVRYLMDTKGGLAIPAIPAPRPTFSSAEDAVKAALDWEQEVTRQITNLMDMAVGQNDYLAQSFLQWFAALAPASCRSASVRSIAHHGESGLSRSNRKALAPRATMAPPTIGMPIR